MYPNQKKQNLRLFSFLIIPLVCAYRQHKQPFAHWLTKIGEVLFFLNDNCLCLLSEETSLKSLRSCIKSFTK